MDSEAHIRVSDCNQGSFQDLWTQWTIQFGGTGGRRSPGGFTIVLPGSGTGGSDRFPLIVTATLMDSILIESGLHHFADLIEMNEAEKAAFHNRYFDRFNPEHHLLIWCDIRTSQAANYLNLDHWTIYIEDNEENRFEPVQILQEQAFTHQTIMARPLAFQAEFGLPPIEIHLKRVMLCFPKRDFYGNLVQWEGVQYLKLVFHQNEDEHVKGQGKWVFNR